MSNTKKTLVPPLKKRDGDDSSGTESKGTGTTPRSARKTSDAPPTKSSGNNNVNNDKEGDNKSNTARNARTARGKNRRRRKRYEILNFNLNIRI
jgi:hypothetical protein